MFRKIVYLSILLPYLFTCLLFTGCQETENKNSDLKKILGDAIPKPAPQAPINWNKKDINTIIIFFDDLPEGYNRILDEINIRTRDLLGINVVFRSSRLYMEQKSCDLVNLIVSHDYDAMVVFPSNGSINQNYEGGFRDITNDFPQYAPQLYSKYSKQDLAQVTNNGRIYGVPSLFQETTRYCALVLKELVDRYGIEPIKTFEDYENFLELVKKNEPDMFPCYQGWMELDMFIEPAGYEHCIDYFVYRKNEEDIKFIPWEATDSFVDAVNTLKRWKNNGYFIKVDNNTPNSTKKIASYIRKMDHSIVESYTLSENDYEIYPLYPDITMSKVQNLKPAIMINQRSIKTAKVLKFLEWAFSSQENYDLLMYGIQGEDYELAGNEVKMLKNSSGKKYDGIRCFRIFQNPEYMRNPYSLTTNLVEIYKKAEETSRYKPTLWFAPGFNIDSLRQRSQIIGKQPSNILFGSFDMDPLEFRRSQEESGVYSIANKMQNYWEEWKVKYKDLLP